VEVSTVPATLLNKKVGLLTQSRLSSKPSMPPKESETLPLTVRIGSICPAPQMQIVAPPNQRTPNPPAPMSTVVPVQPTDEVPDMTRPYQAQPTGTLRFIPLGIHALAASVAPIMSAWKAHAKTPPKNPSKNHPPFPIFLHNAQRPAPRTVNARLNCAVTGPSAAMANASTHSSSPKPQINV
jgi:hypothetical protein